MSCKIRKHAVLVIFYLIFPLLVATTLECAELPSAYDLRDAGGHCYITPVKSQIVPGEWWNCVGICWACSSLASFESSLLKQGIVSGPDSHEANLSPWYLGCYIGYNHPNYEFNDTLVGDPPVPISYQLDSTMQYGYAGSPLYTVDYLGTGKGLVPEYLAPVPIEQMRLHETLEKPEEDLPSCYMLRAGLVYERQDYDSDEEYRRAIKNAVMQHGALASGMYLCPADFPGQEGESYYRDDDYTDYYCDDPEKTDTLVHMVTIAGWDDDKVIEGAPNQGAWLIKDSMGVGMHDQGYLWISYDDTVFLKGHSYALSCVADSGEGYSRRRYMTSPRTLCEPVTGASMYESDGFGRLGLDSWGCARFTAWADGDIRAVGLITVNSGEQITVNVFRGWNETRQEPVTLLHSEEITVEEHGYHVIDLSHSVRLEKDREYVIALGFASNPEADREPLVYVTDLEPSSRDIRTYWASADTGNGPDNWVEYNDERENAVIYMECIMEEETGGRAGCNAGAYPFSLLLPLALLLAASRF